MSLVYTNDNCIGCNKCIGACSCMGANVQSEVNGQNRIDVDGDRCVACGACFDACKHHAREFNDDTERFFADLAKGEKISILIAPAFLANYPNEYEKVLGGLKQCGVNRMISISFGADITTWGYLNYIQKYNYLGGISQPCPAVVGYIERYIPKLLPKLFPVQSPMMCGAIYAKKYMGITDKLAFISPCIAKKMEIDDPNNKGIVSYNVTFDHLMKYVREHNISGAPVSDEIEYGLGSVYPMPGGLKENVYWFLGESVLIRQMEGEKHMYHFLEENKDKISASRTPYLFIDALNCANGCLYGTGTEEEKNRGEDTLYEMLRIREAVKKNDGKDAWARSLTPAQRLDALNKQFEALDLNDFLRAYTDRSASCAHKEPSAGQLDKIYLEMNKRTHEQRHIDCSCCGYDSCEDMARAIFNGYNTKVNCIHYIKDLSEAEKAEIESMAGNLNVQTQEIIDTVARINQEFVALNESVDAMEKGNNINAEESNGISSDIAQVSTFCQELESSVVEINQLLKELEKNNNSVVSIANKTNLLALNASIEAARAGEAGRGFAVVAKEINSLAGSSKETAGSSNESQVMIEKATGQILERSQQLMEIVTHVSDRISNLAASAEEMAVSSTSVADSADSIQEMLDGLVTQAKAVSEV